MLDVAIAKIFDGKQWIGLDANNADTVDGKHASDFASASHTHTKSHITDLGLSWNDITGKPSSFTLPLTPMTVDIIQSLR